MCKPKLPKDPSGKVKLINKFWGEKKQSTKAIKQRRKNLIFQVEREKAPEWGRDVNCTV